MPSLSPAFDAARASRGYLFSTVSCAVLLVGLAVVQWLRGAQPADSWSLRISAPARSGDLEGWPLDHDPNLHGRLFTDEVLAKARRQIESTSGATYLESGAALRKSLSVVTAADGPPEETALRLSYVGQSPHGAAYLHALAEHLVAEWLHASRSSAAARLQSAQAARVSVRQDYRSASDQLEQTTRTAESLQQDIRDMESQLATLAQPRQQTSPQRRDATAAGGANEEQRAALEQDLSALQAHRVRLLKQYTSHHPLIQEVEGRIAEASTALKALSAPHIPAHADSPSASSRLDEQAAALAQSELEAELAKQRRRLDTLNATRDQQMARLATLQERLDQQEEQVEAATATLARVEHTDLQITDPQRAPAALRSSDAFGLFFSLVLGCLMGSIASIGAKNPGARLQDRSQIESILALPVVGQLPGGDDFPSPPPVAQPNTASGICRAAEATLGLFVVATLIAAACVDGFFSRLTSQPLSAMAGSVRDVVQQVLG